MAEGDAMPSLHVAYLHLIVFRAGIPKINLDFYAEIQEQVRTSRLNFDL
jgi:hypothetical protein